MNELFNVLVFGLVMCIAGMVLHSAFCHSYPDLAKRIHDRGQEIEDKLRKLLGAKDG